MKLNIREFTKSKYDGRYKAKYKKGKFRNWRIIPGH